MERSLSNNPPQKLKIESMIQNHQEELAILEETMENIKDGSLDKVLFIYMDV